jgi:hypothetical protein
MDSKPNRNVSIYPDAMEVCLAPFTKSHNSHDNLDMLLAMRLIFHN